MQFKVTLTDHDDEVTGIQLATKLTDTLMALATNPGFLLVGDKFTIERVA